MIPIGHLIAKPDTGLKILTPWWDVLSHYLTAAIMTIALTATALQAALDNLICIPAVDCSEFVKDPLAVWNKTLPNNHLLGDICSKGRPVLNTSHANGILMTTMSDRRQYDFIDSTCYQNILPWFTAFFPFIIFGEAVLFLLFDNFWSKMPRTSSTLNHFVALVTECYNAEATLSDVLKEVAEKENEDENDEDQSSGTSTKPEKQPLLDTPDVKFKSGAHEPEDQKGSKEEVTTPTPASSHAASIKALYEKVGKFKRSYKSTYFLLRVYKLRAFLQIIMCIFALTVNFLHYSSLRDTVECRLKQVFITDYEFFQCSRFIAPFYRAMVVILAIPTVMCFGTSFYALFWVFYNSQNARVKTNETTEYVRIRGDMSLLYFLLDEYDKLYSNRLAAFLSKEKRKTIERKLTDVHKRSFHKESSL